MSRHISYSILIIFGMVVFSCADEEISWEVEESPELLVVEGSFTSEKKKHRITLSKTADYFLNKRTPRVSGADVTIKDLTGGSRTYEFEELQEKEGVYESVRKVAGRAGHNYALNIHLQEPVNNKTHYQASEQMIEGIDLESMEALIYRNPFYQEEFPTDSLVLFIALYGHDPGNIDNLYMVDLYRNGKLLQDTVDEKEIFSDSEQFRDGEYIHDPFTFFEEFQPGDTVAIKISTVTKSYQQFMEGINNITDQSGNPFDLSGPPANAIGNIEGKALGYFRVSYVSRAKAVVVDQRSVNEYMYE